MNKLIFSPVFLLQRNSS